jgi:hypothetical protein
MKEWRHAACGGALREMPQAASAGRRSGHREARRVPGLAARWKMGGKFTLARPYARLRRKPISREMKFSPKLSIASTDFSRKSAKRRRSGLS